MAFRPSIDLYTYAHFYVYVQKYRLLCTFYAEKHIFNAFSTEKLRERFEKLSDLRKILSLSFENLTVTVATGSRKVKIQRLLPTSKSFSTLPDVPLHFVKPILHKTAAKKR